MNEADASAGGEFCPEGCPTSDVLHNILIILIVKGLTRIFGEL